MRYAFLLYKNITDLGAQEVISLAKPLTYTRIANLLIVETEGNEAVEKLSLRLAYTNSIYLLLFESDYENFIAKMENFEWNKVYKGSFCVRAHKIGTIKNSSIENNSIKKINKSYKKDCKIKNPYINKLYPEKKLASFIWRKVKNPKVDLENPKTRIDVFFTEKRIYCCLLLKNLEHYFQSRRPHLRPAPSPISLHPKLARAIVNLTGAQKGDIILDPFCGSGGILIEAGLMGMKIEGYDLNRKMVWKSMTNLKHYGIGKYNLKAKDFFKINKKYKYIAADLPYGLNACIMENVRVTKTNRKEMTPYVDEFYSKVVRKLEKIVGTRAVIIFPNYSNYKKLIKSSKLNIKKEFSCYVHGNLTRKILILEK